MVAVPRSSVDQVKLITEHDLLKFAGVIGTALLIPLLIWSFTTLHNDFSAISNSVHELDTKVAVLQSQIKQFRELTSAEFDATKSQIRATNLAVIGLRTDTGDLLRVITTKTAKRKP